MTNNETKLQYNYNLLPKGEHQQFTRNTTVAQTGAPTATNFGAKQSKINQAFWKARKLIDLTIESMLQKRESVTAAVQVVAENNKQILNAFGDEKQLDEQPSFIYHHCLDQRATNGLDPQTIQLFKQIENEKKKTQNLQKKCQQLTEQNQYIRESELGNINYQQDQHPVFVNRKISKGKRQLLAQLQNLQIQNLMLREQTMKIKRTSKY